MINCFKASSRAGAGILVLMFALPLRAADSSASPSPPIAQGAGTELEEVIVTARRKEENLQDVPESLSAVTSEELQKYNINELSDVGRLVPGFTADFADPVATFTLRGLSTTASNIPPTMVQYLNDAPVNSTLLFSSMYDVGQIEILRGPQGTLRGKIAETGALTLTTHQPDLEEIAGYAQVTKGNLDDTNLQGAVGFPIVNDKLAIRIAGIYDDNKGSDVGSVNSTTPPRSQVEGGRVTVKFVPTDNFDAVISYEHEHKNGQHYGGPYFGPGNGMDGPPLTVSQLQTVQPSPSLSSTDVDAVEGTLNFAFAGQKLTYVGSYSRLLEHQFIQFNAANIDDVSDLLPTTSLVKEWNQDIRISSAEPLFHGLFDYVVGFFYDNTSEPVSSDAGTIYLPGAFGSPLGAAVAGPPNLLFSTSEFYSLPTNVQAEQAYYANGTIHIDHATELSGGLRYSREEHDILTFVNVPSGVAAVALPASFCGPTSPISQTQGGMYGVTYPGVCNVPTPPTPVSIPQDHAVYHPVIYNVELSHRFNDDLMAYLRTGSSWRNGALNPVLGAHTGGNPQFAPYLLPAPEKMKDYEAGLKGDLFDKRLTFDIDYFHMVYSSFLYTAQAAWYLDYTGGVPTATHASVGSFDLPAKIDGIELNAAGRITRQWTASGAFAWANGRVSGSGPCDPPGLGPNASPAAALAALQAAGVVTFTCPGLHDSTSHIPKWNLNISSEYEQPITDKVSGFIRGLWNYYPSNSSTSLVGYTAPSYSTLDVYIGARQPNAKWEVSLYAKNITNDRTITDIPASVVTSAEIGTLAGFFPTPSGYSQATIVPPREFGIRLRQAFGSQ